MIGTPSAMNTRETSGGSAAPPDSALENLLRDERVQDRP
jgi:hypothetical protein